MSKNPRSKIALYAVGAAMFIAMVLMICLWGLNSGSGGEKVIGLVLSGKIDETGWNTSHYNGAKKACAEYNAKLIVKESVYENQELCSAAIDELVSEGAELILFSSGGYAFECEESLKKYPDVKFFCTFENTELDNLTAYFARMYQARYISGIIAAAQSETHKLGYVAAENCCEVIRGIDAFALGARSYDPEAEIDVIFTGEWDNKEKECSSADRLIGDYNCDVIAYHQNLPNAAAEADRLGVYSIGYHEKAEGLSDKYLTSIVWNWQTIYHEIIKDYVQDNDKYVKRYWLGIDAGAASLTEFSPLVSPEARTAVEKAEKDIKNGKDVFSGLIHDNSGNIRCREDEAISDDILFTELNWFVQGVNVYD